MDIDDSTLPGRSSGGTETRTGRRGVAAGLAVGLLGGAAAGFAFGVPGLTSAATDDAVPAGLVRQADDTDPVEPAEDADDTTAAREPGTRLRAALQDLVDDGTISAEQADAVAAHLVEQRPDRGGFGERHGRGGFGSRAGGVMSEAVTDLLGLTPAELREQLRDGATLAEVAEAQGVSTDALVDEIVGEIEERIAQGVENGRLDQAEADEKLAEVEERVTDMVENGPDRDRDRLAGD